MTARWWRAAGWRRGSATWDLLATSAATIARRPGRALLAMAGTLVGVGAVVATLGVTTTSAAQLRHRLDELRPAEVVVEDRQPRGPDRPFPPDAEARLARLTGVRAAGVLWTTTVGEQGVRRIRGGDVAGTPPVVVPVVAAEPAALRAAGAAVGRGRLYDHFHDRRGEPVALLGAAAARKLGVADLSRRPAVFLGDRPLTVIGIVDGVDRRGELLRSVIVPATTATRLWGLGGARQEVLIHTARGAAQLVGRQAPLALRPHDPGRLVAVVPPEPVSLRRHVDADLTALLLLLAGLSLVAGATGIASTTALWVIERSGELGLRRALGAHRRRIAAQILVEGAMLGTLGGVVGALGGVVLVIVVAVARRWTAVVEPRAILLAPLLGALIGLLAGLYPVLRARRPDPTVPARR